MYTTGLQPLKNMGFYQLRSAQNATDTNNQYFVNEDGRSENANGDVLPRYLASNPGSTVIDGVLTPDQEVISEAMASQGSPESQFDGIGTTIHGDLGNL